jgi:hypothetical protein
MTELPETRADEAVDTSTGTEASQQCGRCRRVFEMEPTHEAGTMPELWYCANCRVALLGRPTSVVKPSS